MLKLKVFKSLVFLAWIWQVLLITRLIQSLCIATLLLFFLQRTQNKTLPLPIPEFFLSLNTSGNPMMVLCQFETQQKPLHSHTAAWSWHCCGHRYHCHSSSRARATTGFFSTGTGHCSSCTANYTSHCAPWITFLFESPAQELSSLSSSLLKLSDWKALIPTGASFAQYSLSTIDASYFDSKKEILCVGLGYLC